MIPLPPMVAVRAPHIDSVGHDGEFLYVLLKSGGGLFKYENVTRPEFAALCAAPDIGHHFKQHIKGWHRRFRVA